MSSIFTKNKLTDFFNSKTKRGRMRLFMHEMHKEEPDLTYAKELLRQGCDHSYIDGRGYNALILSSGSGDVEIIKTLYDSGAYDLDATIRTDVPHHRWTAPLYAACYGHTDMIAFYLKKGLDPNHWPAHTESLLHKAAGSWRGDEIVKMLIEAGCDTHKPNSDKETAIINAVTHGNAQSVELLLDARPDSFNDLDRSKHKIIDLASWRVAEAYDVESGVSLALEVQSALEHFAATGRTRLSIKQGQSTLQKLDQIAKNSAKQCHTEVNGVTPVKKITFKAATAGG